MKVYTNTTSLTQCWLDAMAIHQASFVCQINIGKRERGKTYRIYGAIAEYPADLLRGTLINGKFCITL